MTVIGLSAGLLLAGAILTETVFAFDGSAGSSAMRSATGTTRSCRDSLIIATMYVFVNLIVDVSYGLIDPRIRVQ